MNTRNKGKCLLNSRNAQTKSKKRELFVLNFDSWHQLRDEIRNQPLPQEFPPNLNQSILYHSCLNNNPMERNWNSLPTVCSKSSFWSWNYWKILEELEVEESAMPKFRSLQITNHKWLRKLPKGMKYVTALQVLELKGMSGRFVDHPQGQYHHKIHHVPSIIKSRSSCNLPAPLSSSSFCHGLISTVVSNVFVLHQLQSNSECVLHPFVLKQFESCVPLAC